MGTDEPVYLRFDAFELDERNARLARDGQAVPLSPKALGVLCTLARTPDQLVTKAALLDAVWGHRHVSESLLKTMVSEIRSALGDSAREPLYVETVARFGYRFLGARVRSSVVAAAPSGEARSLIARDDALERLRQGWRDASGGRLRLIWIAGEAGIGKTALLDRFLSEVGTGSGARGRCVEHIGRNEPYLPLLEVLRELANRDPAFVAPLRAVAPSWALQMPWLIPEQERLALRRELVGAHQARMLRELRELFDRCTQTRPQVIALEDLHWSDGETVAWLDYLAQTGHGLRTLWIGTFRPAQLIAEDHPLRTTRQRLRAKGLADELLLEPFSEAAVRDFVTARWPRASVSDGFVRRLQVHTGGLPLFLATVGEAVLDSFAPDGERVLDADAPLPVPETLAGTIETELSRLPDETQTLLAAASVCGVSFRASAAAAVFGVGAERALEHCDRLVQRELWLHAQQMSAQPDGTLDAVFTFRHALYQQALYTRATPVQRAQWHRRYAQLLVEARGRGETVSAAELALHHERGHRFPDALRAYAAAAYAALGRFAPREAGELAARGLALLGRCDDTPERRAIEFELQRATGVSASLEHGVASLPARAATERVRALYLELPRTAERAVALDGLGWMYFVRGEFEQTLRLAEELEQAAATHADPVLGVFACNLAGVARVNRGELRAACMTLSRGIERCATLPADLPITSFVVDPEASMRVNLVIPLAQRGEFGRAHAELTRGVARAESVRQPLARMLAVWVGGMLAARLDDTDGVAAAADALDRLMDVTLLRQVEGPRQWLRGLADARRGEPRAGYARIREGYARHAAMGMYAGCPEVLGYGAEALLLAGDVTGCEDQLAEAHELAERIGERLALPMLELLGARAARARGADAVARERVASALAECERQEAFGVELDARTFAFEQGARGEPERVALAAVLERLSAERTTRPYRRAMEALASRAS